MALLHRTAAVLRAPAAELPARIAHMQEQVKTLEKALSQARSTLAAKTGQELVLKQTVEISGVKVLAARLDHVDTKTLREIVDQSKQTLARAVVLLVTSENEKIKVVGGVTANLTDRIKAGDLVGFVSTQLGGTGGGRADMAMGGGNNITALPAALASVQQWVAARLA
jgi:alanyl-tRNA synthetase